MKTTIEIILYIFYLLNLYLGSPFSDGGYGTSGGSSPDYNLSELVRTLNSKVYINNTYYSLVSAFVFPYEVSVCSL